MLTTIVSGLLRGTAGDNGLIEWLQVLRVDFCHKLGFTRRPPKLDGFRDLLMRLDPACFDGAALERVLREWGREFFPHAQDELLAVLRIDRKTHYGSARSLHHGVHLLSLVAHGSVVVLAQSRVDEKTNEHKGAIELLETVLLKDVVIVGETAFCHRDVVFREDKCTLSTGNARRNLEALRNAPLTRACNDGNFGVASRLRRFTRRFKRAFAMLGILQTAKTLGTFQGLGMIRSRVWRRLAGSVPTSPETRASVCRFTGLAQLLEFPGAERKAIPSRPRDPSAIVRSASD